MECAEAYLPIDRRFALASNTTLPDTTSGAALFADISGFTPMTEALVRHLGPRRGAEELTLLLNRVYDALIADVHRYRGSVISFAGDAITCWLDQDNGLRATACGLAMQHTMQQFASFTIASDETMSLAMKAAVAVGPVRRFLVGDPNIQYVEVLAGNTLDQMASAEKHADKGDVVVTPATARALGDMLSIVEWRGEPPDNGYAVVNGLTVPVAIDPWPQLQHALSIEQIRPWILPPVYDRLLHGQQFLAELRPGVPMFLRFQGIDYDNDPDAGTKLNIYIRWVQQVLARYGGYMLQLIMGDKGSYMCAGFGAPVAHENDPERAVAAALELRTPPHESQTYIESVQIGMTQGGLRTGAYGSSARHVYGIHGDEVNLAARLMSYAEPGNIVVSSRIVEHTQHYFEFATKDAIRVKGKSVPIEIAYALGRKQPTQKQLVSLTHNPLVGREKELAEIGKVLSTVLTGHGHSVGLEGVAGIGKSHLVAEFIRRASQRGLQVFVGASQSTSQGIAYAPWRQIFRAFFALEDEPQTDGTNAGINNQIAQVTMMVQHMNADWVLRLPILGDLLDLPIPDNPTTAAFDARLRQEVLFALVVDIMQTWTEDMPLLLVLEDVHWMDEASYGLTLAMSRALHHMPVLLLLVHRPPLREHIERAGGMVGLLHELADMPNYHALSLNELSPDAAAGLVKNRVQGTVCPSALSLILSRTQGNPFFLEELVDTLRESKKLVLNDAGIWTFAESVMATLHEAGCLVEDEQGLWQLVPDAQIPTDALGIPDSVHSIVLSRIDRLPEEYTLTLKVASVIGHIFELDILARSHPSTPDRTTLSAQIETFEERDFARLETPDPRVSYIFKHNITREVVYETLLQSQRQMLHQAVGDTLEQIHPDAVEQLAYHYSRTDIRDKALLYLDKAASKARHDYANETALRYYQQALELEVRWQWQQAVVEILHMMGLREDELAALHLLENTDDVPEFVVAYLWGRYYEAISDYPQAHSTTERALATSRTQQNRMNEVLCLGQLGMIARRQGDYERSQSWYMQAMEHIQIRETHAGGLSPETTHAFAQVLKGLGSAYTQQSKFDEARKHYELALLLNQSSGNRQGEADVLNSLGVLADEQGNLADAETWYQQALDIRRAIGERAAEGGSLLNLAIVLCYRGYYMQARDYLLDALTIQQNTGNLWEEVNVYNVLGILYRIIGDLAQAEHYLQRGLAVSQAIGDESGQAYILSNMGAVLRDRGDLQQAEATLNTALDLVREQGDMWMVADVLSFLATVSVLAGDYPQAVARAEEALTIQRNLDMLTNTIVNLSTLATASLRLGLCEEALAYARQAIDLLDSKGGEGMETPQYDYCACSHVFAACGDTEAAHQAHAAARRLVMERGERLTDPVLRRSYLEQVAVNRQIVTA